WSNGQTTATANGLGAGTFTLTVTDHNGCIGSDPVTITQPSAISVSNTTTANVSCNGGTNGTASSTVSGGTSPYTYSWSNGQTTATANGLGAGTFTLTVTDHSGCISSDPVTITQPSAISVSNSTTGNVSCNGGTNGTASST